MARHKDFMIKYLRLGLGLSLLLLAACSQQFGVKTPAAEQLLRLDYRSQLDLQNHQYFVYLPRGYGDQPQKNWPVLVFLHGNGERGNGRDELDYVMANGPLYEAWIQKKDLPFIIISPQLAMLGMDKLPYIAARTRAQIPQRLAVGVPPRNARFATPQVMSAGESVVDMSGVAPLLPMGWEQVETDLLAMIARVQRDYRTDPARLYLTGLSYGGFGTWYMASKHPELFAAIAPVVGWGHPTLMPPIAKADLPVWAFAGGRDTSVQKQYFYAGLNKLEELGISELRFSVQEDMGHDTWTRVYAGDDLYQWLLSHTKAAH
jgi:predicted peptidase